MSDEAVTDAARLMISQRWGAQRPIRMARELALRANELPADERQRLLDALTPRTDQEKQ